MKKIIPLLTAVILILSSISVFAAETVIVTLNGNPIEFDVPAQIINDRTMVPMRKIFESLGADVDWVEEQQGIVAIKDSKIIVMKIGSGLMIVSDILAGTQEEITLDVPPQIVDDRTLVPVRAISESLGVSVDWVAETQTVVLTK